MHCATQGTGRRKHAVSSDMGSPLVPQRNPSPERVKNGKSMMPDRDFGLLRGLKCVSPRNMTV